MRWAGTTSGCAPTSRASASEVAALEQAELPEPLIKRLQQVSQQCLEALGGQG
mgnify:CR=1 FL=1